MIVLVAGANGRLGGLVVALLLGRGHAVRGLVRRQEEAGALEELGATALVGDLRGDVEWAAAGCDAVVFAAAARDRASLGAVDGGGAAKLAEAADHYELRRFVLCSAVGAGAPDRRTGLVRDFLAAKHHAERRLERLDMPWTVLRFGRLTDATGTGRIETQLRSDGAVTLSRDDAALTAVAALERGHLARQVVHVVDGERHVADALDAIEPLPPPAVRPTGLGAAQTSNPPPARNMLAADASPLDADVDFEGDGPLPPELVGNDDPAPGIP
jgi:nucleoside-diphosphate-sugar epimerase